MTDQVTTPPIVQEGEQKADSVAETIVNDGIDAAEVAVAAQGPTPVAAVEGLALQIAKHEEPVILAALDHFIVCIGNDAVKVADGVKEAAVSLKNKLVSELKKI